MMRLVLSDLLHHPTAWLGLLLISLISGCIAEFAASVISTSLQSEGVEVEMLRNAGTMVIVFSGIVAVPIITLATRLFVDEKRKTYALWRLSNVSPKQIRVIVTIQLVIIAIVGSLLGALLMLLLFGDVFFLVFYSRESLRELLPMPNPSSIPLICLLISVMYLLGGTPGLKVACRISPLIILRPEYQYKRFGVIRIIGIIISIAIMILFINIMASSEFELSSMIAMLSPIATTVLFALLAPVFLPIILKFWTSFMKLSNGVILPLARSRALHNMQFNTLIESSVMILIGLITGMYSSLDILSSLSLDSHSSNNFSFDYSLSMLMFGGPVVLGVAGATLTTLVSARSQESEAGKLLLMGATRTLIVRCVVCEALIHSITAFIGGSLCCLTSTLVVYFGMGMNGLLALSVLPGLYIALSGFLLIAISMLFPALAAFGTSSLKSINSV